MSDSLWPHGLQPTRILSPWDFPGKNPEVGCHFLLLGIFPTRGLNPCLLHWQTDSLPLSHQYAGLIIGSDKSRGPVLCLKEKKGGDRVDKLVFLLPFLNYYTTQISFLKKLCDTEASVSYSFDRGGANKGWDTWIFLSEVQTWGGP